LRLASQSRSRGTGGWRTISDAQRLISLSSCEAPFYSRLEEFSPPW
jgi:hypothetical protein